MTPTWADMTPKKITTGIKVASCDGDHRVLVPMGADMGSQSGVARLLEKNVNTPSFFGKPR